LDRSIADRRRVAVNRIRLAALVVVLGGVLSAGAAPPAVVVADLRSGPRLDFQGSTREVVYHDKRRTLALSTELGTWRVVLAKHLDSTKAPPEAVPGGRLRLGAGGGVFLRDAPGSLEAPVRHPPAGPPSPPDKELTNTLLVDPRAETYLVLRGGRVITAIPQGYAEAARGSWHWQIWSVDGTAVRDLGELPGAVDVVPDATGSTFAIVSPDGVRVFDEDGNSLRPLIPGGYWHVAISERGNDVMLVAAKAPATVRLVSGPVGDPLRSLDAGFPVDGVAIAANGRAAVAWSLPGTLLEINVGAANAPTSWSIAPDETVQISHVLVHDAGYLTIGMRVSGPGGESTGRISRVRARRELWRDEFPIEKPYASEPKILAPDKKLVVAWTRDRVRIVRAPNSQGNVP
jgi:hypothetical protein